MNPLNDEDEDTSNCVQEFVRRMVTDIVKHNFMAGSYCCAEDNGQSTTLHGFLGTKILEANLQNAVVNRSLHPNPDLVSPEVWRVCNVRHIVTKMMQSLISPPEIVHEMDAADHRANRGITPSALYTSIKAVIKLMY